MLVMLCVLCVSVCSFANFCLHLLRSRLFFQLFGLLVLLFPLVLCCASACLSVSSRLLCGARFAGRIGIAFGVGGEFCAEDGAGQIESAQNKMRYVFWSSRLWVADLMNCERCLGRSQNVVLSSVFFYKARCEPDTGWGHLPCGALPIEAFECSVSAQFTLFCLCTPKHLCGFGLFKGMFKYAQEYIQASSCVMRVSGLVWSGLLAIIRWCCGQAFVRAAF